MMCHCLCLFFGFWDGDYVRQLPYVWYYVGVKSRFQHASPRGPMCFRCMMFSMSGPCFNASWT